MLADKLADWYALVSRIYKPNCEETSLEINPMLRQRDIRGQKQVFIFFFWTIVNFEHEYFPNEDTEGGYWFD